MNRTIFLIAVAVLWLCIAISVVVTWPELVAVEYPGVRP